MVSQFWRASFWNGLSEIPSCRGVLVLLILLVVVAGIPTQDSPFHEAF